MSRRKKVRMKRAYLNRFSQGKLPQKVDGHSPLRMFGTQREMTQEEIEWRYRRDLWIDKRLMEVYGRIVDRPPAMGVFNRGPPKAWQAVQDALSRLNLEEQTMWEDRDAHQRRITLKESPIWKVELIWSRDHKRYILLEFDGLDGCVRESIRYTSRDRAVQVFLNKDVNWKYVTCIPAE